MGKRESSTKSLFEEQATESNLVKVYLGDWYLNAGIVGFLKVLCEGDFEKLTSFGERLVVGENFIEFDVSILDGFKDKFYRQLFLGYFNKNQYLAYIKKASEQKKKDGGFDVAKAKKEVDKFPFKGLFEVLRCDLESQDDFIAYKSRIEEMNKEDIYELVKNDSYLSYFIGGVTKGIIGLSYFEVYIKNTIEKKYIAKSEKDKVCIACQERKVDAKGALSNAISNIIGFNSDNSNWTWGFDGNKVRLCSVCSLVYLSASISLVYAKKGSEYRNCFYFINHNGSIDSLIKSYMQFRIGIDAIREQKSVYPVMVKEVVNFVKSAQADKTIHNISFVEIEESGMGGQSTKGYNVYPFSVSKKLAKFIAENLDGIPRGFYKIDKEYFDIEEEMLRVLLERKLGYKDIDRLLRIYIKGDGGFAVSNVVGFILKYINHLKGDKNVDLEKIGKKGFGNGKELREKFGKERENQINGLVYQLLNDLKVADKERFLDKYLRISMSNGMESRFGSDEMNDKDAFLQFGYSFVNGLMNTYTKEKKENENA